MTLFLLYKDNNIHKSNALKLDSINSVSEFNNKMLIYKVETKLYINLLQNCINTGFCIITVLGLAYREPSLMIFYLVVLGIIILKFDE